MRALRAKAFYNLQPLLRADGKLRDRGVRIEREPSASRNVIDALPGTGRAKPPAIASERHVFGDAHCRGRS